MPIRHQSGRSDISSDRGHTSPGSYPSTMEAPPSNQDGLHRIQVIQRTQEVFGRTLKESALCGRYSTEPSDIARSKALAGIFSSVSRLSASSHEIVFWSRGSGIAPPLGATAMEPKRGNRV